jgi:hypothetical protein
VFAVSLSIACLDRINCAIYVLPSPNIPTRANR